MLIIIWLLTKILRTRYEERTISSINYAYKIDVPMQRIKPWFFFLTILHRKLDSKCKNNLKVEMKL